MIEFLLNACKIVRSLLSLQELHALRAPFIYARFYPHVEKLSQETRLKHRNTHFYLLISTPSELALGLQHLVFQ